MTADDLHRLADVSVHGFLAASAVGTVMWWLGVRVLVEGY